MMNEHDELVAKHSTPLTMLPPEQQAIIRAAREWRAEQIAAGNVSPLRPGPIQAPGLDETKGFQPIPIPAELLPGGDDTTGQPGRRHLRVLPGGES